MLERFGKAFDSIDQTKIAIGSDFMTDFEDNKRVFGEEGEKLNQMRLFLKGAPKSDYYDVDEGYVTLTE